MNSGFVHDGLAILGESVGKSLYNSGLKLLFFDQRNHLCG